MIKYADDCFDCVAAVVDVTACRLSQHNAHCILFTNTMCVMSVGACTLSMLLAERVSSVCCRRGCRGIAAYAGYYSPDSFSLSAARASRSPSVVFSSGALS